MVVIKFSHDDEVIAMANDSDFGWVAVYSPGTSRGWYIAQKLKVGMANLNDFGVNLVQGSSIWGIRLSGYGRFGGPEGLRECCAMKSTTRNLLVVNYIISTATFA